MKKLINLIGLLFLVFTCLNAQTPYFYYYGGEKQYFELDTRYIFVSVADESTADKILVSYNAKYTPVRVDIPDGNLSRTNQNKRFWSVLKFENKLSDDEYLAKLSEIKNTEKGIIVAPYFKNQYQEKIGLSNFFYVKLKDLNDTVVLKQEAEKEHTVIMWQNEFRPLWFTLSVTDNSKYNAMELSNRFYESGLFQYAEPDLMIDTQIQCANDQYFGQQWGLKNTGQSGGKSGIDIKICDAWQISTGNNVIVAVLDNGILLTHPDLAANIYPLSYDSNSKTSPQTIHYQIDIPYHGTMCAGIIGAARDNVVGNTVIGIAGVAPNSRIMSISNSLDGTVASNEAKANGIDWAWRNGADIISNSWGCNYTQNIADAIDNAVTFGRHGLGCVVVASSGNYNSTNIIFPATLPDVITVGAINRKGKRWYDSFTQQGSNYGDNLDVMAPGEDIWSTVLNNSYDSNTGTSYAAPYVSGIAALILSINPTMKLRDVRNIIESTAQKVGGYKYKTEAGHDNGTWYKEMGYGLVNAYAAVQKAVECLTTTVNFVNKPPITTDTTVTSCGDIYIQNVTVTNNATLILDASGNINIQSVTVTNNSKLILDVGGAVNIGSDFDVQFGSSFEIK